MSKAPDEFVYRATLDRVIDGDTFDCILDLGFDVSFDSLRMISEHLLMYFVTDFNGSPLFSTNSNTCTNTDSKNDPIII